jgi:hypothetical protein
MSWPLDLPDGLRPWDLADPEPPDPPAGPAEFPADLFDPPADVRREPYPEPDPEYPW